VRTYVTGKEHLHSPNKRQPQFVCARSELTTDADLSRTGTLQRKSILAVTFVIKCLFCLVIKCLSVCTACALLRHELLHTALADKGCKESSRPPATTYVGIGQKRFQDMLLNKGFSRGIEKVFHFKIGFQDLEKYYTVFVQNMHRLVFVGACIIASSMINSQVSYFVLYAG